MYTHELQDVLKARYAGAYPCGHTGAKVLRFQRNTDGVYLIAKFALFTDTMALDELDANAFGYKQLEALGVSFLIPPELREASVSGGRALVMQDLGESVRQINLGMSTW